MAAIALYIPLFYPDGHLPSRRWVWVAVLGGTAAAIGTVCFALTPGPLEGFPGQQNPFGVEGAGWIRTVGDVAMLCFLVALLGTVASLVVRVRRSRGDERQQLKWLALSIALLGVSFLIGVPYWTLSGTGTSLDFVENLVVLGLAGVPIAIGISILKYRLYDIDVVINKAVVYGTLAAFITIVYVAIVVGVGALVGSGGNAVLSAVAAAVIAVAFQPARRRAQRLANRVVYGHRATPYEVLSGFSERLADTYSIEDVLPRLARALADGVGATRVAISLGSGVRERTVASYPDGPDVIGDERVFEVRHQGELLGRIALAMPPNESLVPAQEKLVADVATQAGLVMRNAALIEDLRASRQRLVAAQDEERRRIERNIHDGAQQQLVALAVKLKLTDTLVGDRRGTRARDARGSPGRDEPGSRGSARSRARDLSASARGQGTRGRAPEPGAEILRARLDRARRDRTLPAGSRGGRVLLLPGGTAERLEVRGGLVGDGPTLHSRTERSRSRSSTTGSGSTR